MTDQNTRTWTLAKDLNASHFSNVALSLVDLHRTRLSIDQPILSGITFENCRIEGPAVMAAIGGCSFDGTDFGYSGGDIRSLVLRPASPKSVVGAIPMRDCRFVNCHMVSIGYTGPESFLEQILALGSTPQ